MFKIITSTIQSIIAFFLHCEAFRRGSVVKTKTVLQIETVECGAASLAMVLLHYGRYVPLTQLREICGVSRDGSDASSLVKAARSLDLEAVGYKKSIASLAKMQMPLILFWDFNHFLILEGFSSTTAYLNDPAFGRRKVSLAEFDISYTGVAMAMEPAPSFTKGGIKPSFWPVVFRRLATEPSAALFILIAGFVLIVPNLFMPIFQQIYLDEIIGNNFTNWTKPLLWGLAILILFQTAVKQLELIATRLLEKRLTRKFSAFYEHHILSLPERFYAQRFAAEISSRMALNADVSEFISSKFLPIFTSSLLLVFYLILTLFYSPILGLIVFITTGINAILVTVTLNIQKDANLKIQKDKAKSGNALIGAIQQIETVKASAVEQDVLRRYMGYETRLLNNTQELAILNAKLKVVPSALNTFNEIAILIVGFILIIKGQLTVGMLLASQTIANSLKEKIEKVIGFVQSLPAFEAKIIMLEDIVEQDRDPIYSAPSFIGWSGKRERLSGQIQIDNLSFGYVPIKSPLIQHVNLTINPGERIAFVGGSGSGKSTMAKIVAGLYTPTDGKVLYDGYMLCDIPRSVAVSSLAMVSQEIQLYACSVRDNLTLWNPSINDDEIVHACDEAQILDTILALPDGFNSILKEGAYDLSGGQRQRLEIARALIQNPSILVLDEATSALDSASEQKVVQAFNRRGCTQIIVAHRLSTIRDSDLIVVMEKGSIVQQGSHDEMLKQDGSPYQLLLNESGLT